MAMFELYRKSTIGKCLTEAMDKMVDEGTLPPQLATNVLLQFDKSMAEALKNVRAKYYIKGHLHTYRKCDGVWTFYLHDASFKNIKQPEEEENVSRVTIVATNSKLRTKERVAD